MTKELPLPSKISLILGISYKEVEEVVYFVNYIILDKGHAFLDNPETSFQEREVINLAENKSSKASRGKLRKILRLICEEIANTHPEKEAAYEYVQGQEYYHALDSSNLPFSIGEVFKFVEKHTGIKVGIGAEAIQTLLKKINLEELVASLEADLAANSPINYTDPAIKKLLRRLKVARWLRDSKNKPE